jgi:flagellar basal body-associated protein FliL
MQKVASMLRKKPLWVLLAYLVWQALAVGTGASLWHWRKGGAA